tara:strand:+ start:741 stop:974 length:234 start_codon:yes stop_codon:yes gene_type:complete
MLDREFYITVGSVLLLGFVFVLFMSESKQSKTERQYHLQTIDEDGTHWFVYMSEEEHERWSAKRWAKIKAGLITVNQ